MATDADYQLNQKAAQKHWQQEHPPTGAITASASPAAPRTTAGFKNSAISGARFF
jgi:hypothetical protein